MGVGVDPTKVKTIVGYGPPVAVGEVRTVEGPLFINVRVIVSPVAIGTLYRSIVIVEDNAE